MNSFIPWVGGKSQLREAILQAFPADRPAYYVEVFGGAGWVLFARERHAATEVFNDKDGHLVNLYRCIQYHCEELQRELLRTADAPPPNSREFFEDYREQLDVRGLTDIQRAARYFVIIRLSYGARRETYSCNKRSALGPSIQRLPEIQQRLRDVVVENLDFERLLKTYNRPGALFYLDPPYFKAEGFYQGFGPDDHQRLRDCLEGLQGQWVLSYNDAAEIRELYSGYSIRAVERANSLAGKAKRGAKYAELIITNY